jgi:hypothetical protein
MALEQPSYRTYGHTQVLGCCTFEWLELEGRRLVRLPPGYHAPCLEELQRVAFLLGVHLDFSREGTAA